jgi:hypothetical protein
MGHQDQAWVHALAENLHRAGLEAFLDAWEITPGDVVVHQLERGLLASRNGVLVVCLASVSRPWVQQEYAVMVERAVAGTQRLIPVLLGEVEVPPLAHEALACLACMVDLKFADLRRRTRVLPIHYYRHQHCQVATWQRGGSRKKASLGFKGRGFPLTARQILHQDARFQLVGTPCVVHAGR